MLGSPIRTPPDHSSVANSPGLIAGSYVLHRLLMPRHPPCALHSLSHKHSTKTTKTRRRRKSPSKSDRSWCRSVADARVHYRVGKVHALRGRASADARSPRGRGLAFAADSSGPNSVSGLVRVRTLQVPRRSSPRGGAAVLRGAGDRAGCSSTIPLVNTTGATQTDAGRAGCVLLRKEVIQPHLPVRLPCYDFVPIASPTFDGSLHKG